MQKLIQMSRQCTFILLLTILSWAVDQITGKLFSGNIVNDYSNYNTYVLETRWTSINVPWLSHFWRQTRAVRDCKLLPLLIRSPFIQWDSCYRNIISIYCNMQVPFCHIISAFWKRINIDNNHIIISVAHLKLLLLSTLSTASLLRIVFKVSELFSQLNFQNLNYISYKY